ncbi:MAG TPA: AfsR/SARP family transcriptional regulator [Streptosporangiaceae bacterium]|jgi:DNA-binding SARP family transcriptional activator|nr:AfsR/SARP family transcriptional regulator [Streptosporangiaceae bacterium]
MFREVRFEVLGPVRGWHGKAKLELGSPQQRAVLAMLLLARGRQVSLGALIDGLWGADMPRSAAGTIRTYVSRLRRLVNTKAAGEAGQLIESIGDGYVLRLGSAVLDLDAFEQWLSEGRAARGHHDAARGARLLRDALGLWRGVALAGVPGPYADSRRVPLTELHMAATEEKLAADISLGEHAAAIAELRALLAEHPFREGLSELLMLALYKSGRQAEALDVFDSMRHRLGAELGIDPGPSLQTMHQRVLRADRHLMDGADLRPARLARPVGASMVA